MSPSLIDTSAAVARFATFAVAYSLSLAVIL
jgi:hypothetical protein